MDKLRGSEKEIVTYGDNAEVTACFDFRSMTKLTAILSILRTIYVCIVFIVGSLFFSKDAKQLVIIPIMNMIQKVNKIARDPLEAAQEEENEALKYEKEKQRLKKKYKSKYKKFVKNKEVYETVILEQTIVKIGALLALGFGEAGSKVIAENMARGGDVDPMVPGNKVLAVFGFCDI